MSNYRVGNKVKVPQLNWSSAEIIEVWPALMDETSSASPPYYVKPDSSPRRKYRVKNLENGKTEWVASDELILVA